MLRFQKYLIQKRRNLIFFEQKKLSYMFWDENPIFSIQTAKFLRILFWNRSIPKASKDLKASIDNFDRKCCFYPEKLNKHQKSLS